MGPNEKGEESSEDLGADLSSPSTEMDARSTDPGSVLLVLAGQLRVAGASSPLPVSSLPFPWPHPTPCHFRSERPTLRTASQETKVKFRKYLYNPFVYKSHYDHQKALN